MVLIYIITFISGEIRFAFLLLFCSPGKVNVVLGLVEIKKRGLKDKGTGRRVLAEAFKPVTSLTTLPFSAAGS